MKRYLLLTLFSFILYVADSQNLYTSPNAANISNEQDEVTGWTGPAEIESKDDNPKNGEYCIKIKSEDEGRHARYSFEAIPGTTYEIKIWARRGQSSNAEFDEWEGFSNFQKKNITGQGWKEYVFNVTANSLNPVIKVFASKNSSHNRTVFIDAISIYAINQGDNEPPTAPSNLNSSNVTANSLMLNWSPSSDNTGVTGYKIYRNNQNIGQVSALNYQVTGLSPSTEYTFYVKAYDEEGNTSQASNNHVVSTLEDNGGGSGGGGSGGGSGGSGGSGIVYTNENSNLPTVNWQALNFYSAGSVGIGTMPSNEYRLAVNGIVRTKELIVETGWSDFVFEPGYKLPSLSEVEKHILEYGHLKDIPSANEVEQHGVEVGEINKLLLQKIEELTLYLIEADKEIKALKKDKEDMESRISQIESGK